MLAALPGEFVIESTNHMFQVWHVNNGTKLLNVAGNPAGMSAMTGGTLSMPGNVNWNMNATALSRGDLVFIFGEKVHNTLIAQLVLFLSPFNVSQALAPYASSWNGTINGTNMAVNGTNVMINGTDITQNETNINGQPVSFGSHT